MDRRFVLYALAEGVSHFKCAPGHKDQFNTADRLRNGFWLIARWLFGFFGSVPACRTAGESFGNAALAAGADQHRFTLRAPSPIGLYRFTTLRAYGRLELRFAHRTDTPGGFNRFTARGTLQNRHVFRHITIRQLVYNNSLGNGLGRRKIAVSALIVNVPEDQVSSGQTDANWPLISVGSRPIPPSGLRWDPGGRHDVPAAHQPPTRSRRPTVRQ